MWAWGRAGLCRSTEEKGRRPVDTPAAGSFEVLHPSIGCINEPLIYCACAVLARSSPPPDPPTVASPGTR